ncbi:MAG: hypothetical protein M3Z05_13715 [Gemmatimonadota bacterium]|nr:hypothetical protein [Gemmatimonadota bacterium]
MATGLFRLPAPSARYVSQSLADSIAIGVARFLGNPQLLGNIVAVLEQDRGGPIAFNELSPCRRRTMSASPMGDFPSSVPGWVRRGFGSHWAIGMCGRDGGVQLSVGVPDGPLDIRIVGGSLMLRQFGGGSDFDMVGVPARMPSGLPLTPEAAVAEVFRRTGARVDAVPFAYNQVGIGAGQLPLCASWRVHLEHPVVVTTEATRDTLRATELYVHHVPACFSPDIGFDAAAPEQPASRMVYFPRDTTGSSGSSATDSATVPLSGPTVFFRVVP